MVLLQYCVAILYFVRFINSFKLVLNNCVSEGQARWPLCSKSDQQFLAKYVLSGEELGAGEGRRLEMGRKGWGKVGWGLGEGYGKG